MHAIDSSQGNPTHQQAANVPVWAARENLCLPNQMTKCPQEVTWLPVTEVVQKESFKESYNLMDY